MPSHATIDVTRKDSAARILLNRPDALNAWNEQFGRDLLDAVTTLADDGSVRAVMITGAGRGFSSGADLKEQRSNSGDGLPDLSARLKEIYHPIITGLREMPKPVVAAVNGPAVGIGCSLALAADLVVAAESAYFLLELLAQGPTLSYAGAKELLNRRMYAGLADQLDAEAEAQREQGKSKDFIEGVLAFVEKRPPSFTGS